MQITNGEKYERRSAVMKATPSDIWVSPTKTRKAVMLTTTRNIVQNNKVAKWNRWKHASFCKQHSRLPELDEIFWETYGDEAIDRVCDLDHAEIKRR